MGRPVSAGVVLAILASSCGGGGGSGAIPFVVPDGLALPREEEPVVPAEGAAPLLAPAPEEPGGAERRDWLSRHQSPDGSWDADGFRSRCEGNPCGDPATAMGDAGATGAALLAYLAHGETHRTMQYGAVVKDGLRYLRSVQDVDGAFGPRTGAAPLRDHALASVAMAEAYGLSQSRLFLEPARKGIDFLLRSRTPGGGWGATGNAGADEIEVTVWAVMALRSAAQAGLEVDAAAFREVLGWLDRPRDQGTVPLAEASMVPPPVQDSMALLVRFLCGATREDPAVERERAVLIRSLPDFQGARGEEDLARVYFGTLAVFATSRGFRPWPHDDPDCMRWAEGLRGVRGLFLGPDAGCAEGSVEPRDPCSRRGGRIYATALALLSHAVFYR